jgi:hypothetical protein
VLAAPRILLDGEAPKRPSKPCSLLLLLLGNIISPVQQPLQRRPSGRRRCSEVVAETSADDVDVVARDSSNDGPYEDGGCVRRHGDVENSLGSACGHSPSMTYGEDRYDEDVGGKLGVCGLESRIR